MVLVSFYHSKTLRLYGAHATVRKGLILGVVKLRSGIEFARRYFPDAKLGFFFCFFESIYVRLWVQNPM